MANRAPTFSAIAVGYSMMLVPKLFFAKALRRAVASFSFTSATYQALAEFPEPDECGVMVICRSLEV